MIEHWYRYEDVRYAPPLDEWENPCGPGSVQVHLREYPVAAHTPKGVWISKGISFWDSREPRLYPKDRWIRTDAHKRYACPTKKEAIESFLARKARQSSILSAQLRKIQTAIDKGKRIEQQLESDIA